MDSAYSPAQWRGPPAATTCDVHRPMTRQRTRARSIASIETVTMDGFAAGQGHGKLGPWQDSRSFSTATPEPMTRSR